MFPKFKLAALSVATAAALLITTGCKDQPNHPNQMNTFDGASYDTLTLAHGALSSLRTQVSTVYPQYASEFNQAAAAYSTAVAAYSVYRTEATSAGQSQVTSAINNLTLSVVVLENAFEADMHVSAENDRRIRAEAAVFRASLGSHISAADILTALEIAATIAETVPETQPYSKLAAMVIAATNAALIAEDAAAGQLIDLSTIQSILPIQ